MDAAAQGTITGTVTAAESGGPLAGAQVRVEGAVQGTVTDAMGCYRISIEAGTYTVQVATLGRQNEHKQTTVLAGATSTLNFSLEASGLAAEGVEGIVVNGITGQG